MNVLIVNRCNGQLSACPTVRRYKEGGYLDNEDTFFVVHVSVDDETCQHLYDNRDNAFILHKKLPAHDDRLPDRMYYRVTWGRLKRSLS